MRSFIRIAVFTLLMCGLCALGVIGAQEPPRAIGGISLPPMSYLSLLGQNYAILVVSDGPYGVVLDHGIPHFTEQPSFTQCPYSGSIGQIRVAKKLTSHDKARALIHEIVHAAQQCAHSDVVNEEKVALALSELFDSPVGTFVVEGLRQ
jgi:hypothetical protein